jgi:hypothetical protein
MAFIEVYTENTDGSWNFRGRVNNLPSKYTFPGNQYGSTQTHEWIYTKWMVRNGDGEDVGYGAIAGVGPGAAAGQVIGLNQTITLDRSWGGTGRFWVDWYAYLELYFRIHNLRTIGSAITYLGNGATGGSTNSNTALYNQNFTFQANGFTKTGYSFNSWELTNSNNSIIIIGYYGSGISYGTWDKTGNYNAKAIWEANTYTIFYYQSGVEDGGTTPHNLATYGSNYTFQANGFTKTGYTFLDWSVYEMNDSFIRTYNEGESYGIWNRTSSVKVYARWTANTYTITYNANGVGGDTSGTTTYSTATYDSTFTFKANGFTRTGYSFFKWDLYESNGTTRLNKEYNSEQSYGTWNIPYNIIAKATWNPNSYTVTFDRNGKGTGKTVTQNIGTTVTCPILKAVGYVFGGWALSASSTTVNKEGNATFVLGAANQSFFAIWTENTNGSVSFSELQTVYTGTHPIGISEYRTQSGQTTANSKIALSADFKGKGPAP